MTRAAADSESFRAAAAVEAPSATLEDANRCTRDLIALSTLPAMWLGAHPLRIAESLLAALDTTVGPKLAYIRIQGTGEDPAVEVAHLGSRPVAATQAAALGVTIREWAATHDPDDILTTFEGVASAPLRICVYPLGSDVDAGVLAAGFTSAAEPTSFQRTLLNVAANQAVIACRNSTLQRRQAHLYQRAEKEIAERKQAEAALRQSELRFRATFENAAMGIALVNLDGRFVRANGALAAITGYSEAELLQKTFRELTHPDDVAKNEDVARRLVAGEIATYAVEKRYARKDGSCVWVNVTVSLLHDTEGTPQSFIKLIENIDARKRKEATLAFLVDLNAATQRLADPAEIMAVTAERLGRHLEVDRCAYAEVEREDTFVITGDYLRGVPSIVGRWPVAAFGRECTRLMRANESFVVCDTDRDERVAPHDLPAYRATDIRAVICVPLHKEEKFIAAMAVHQAHPRQWTAEEIELVELVVARCWESLERARALRSLRESERQLRFMAESMPQKIFRANPSGEIDYMNRQWLEVIDFASDNLSDVDWERIIHPEDFPRSVRRWEDALATGQPFEMEQRFLCRDGEYRWHLSRAHPMRDAHGNISMWIGSNTDITDIVKARETLAGRREELEKLVSERTASLREAIEQMEEFSYSVSHDLRAPLRSMQGYAEVLLKDYAARVDDDGQHYLRKIASAAARMDRLTLDVLTYSRVGRTALKPERISLEQLVPGCVEHLDASLNAEVHVRFPLPAVIGNQSLLSQVVSNLVGNAMKFVPKGTRPQITIRGEVRGALARLWIEDNGIGVEPEHQKRIWGMFERVHPDKCYEGTGIGLAIVRKAIERMGGTVGIVSDGKNGSKFWIQLPLALTETAVEAASAAGPTFPARV